MTPTALSRLVERVPSARSAFVSDTGLLRAYCGIARDRADALAEAVGIIFAQARQAAILCGQTDDVQEICMTAGGSTLFCVPVEQGSVLTVVAAPGTEPAALRPAIAGALASQ